MHEEIEKDIRSNRVMKWSSWQPKILKEIEILSKQENRTFANMIETLAIEALKARDIET